MKITTSEFTVSNTDVKKCPQTGLPEYAFIGRSNVGKSSLINMMTGRQALAKVSGTPGKTQLINHFLINKSWYIVDLPGYGYAKVSKSVKSKFQSIITDYVLQREQLVVLFVLVDCRHEPQKIDLEFMEFLGLNDIPFSIIFTKADKLKPSELENNMNRYKQRLLQDWVELPPIFVTSSANATGKEEILDYIEQVNNDLMSQND